MSLLRQWTAGWLTMILEASHVIGEVRNVLPNIYIMTTHDVYKTISVEYKWILW